jgi:hypothetical protein
MQLTQFTSDDRANLQETIKRCRRIETRLTRFLEAEGIQTGIQRPYWTGGRILIPSPMITIDAIVQCIPAQWPTAVPVALKGEEPGSVICHIQV